MGVLTAKTEKLEKTDEVLAKVQSAFQSAFGIDPQSVSIDSTPNDIPAWDSMGHVALASSLETAFGLTFDVEDLMEMEDVKKVVQVVRTKLGKAGSAQ
jgi:acyl carrier protein